MSIKETVIGSPESATVNVSDTTSLRRFLIAGMKDVMNGRITTWQAKAACNFAQQIYNVTALEVKVMLAQEKLRGKPIRAVAFDGTGPADAVINGTSADNSVGVVAEQGSPVGSISETAGSSSGLSVCTATSRTHARKSTSSRLPAER
jgi:hypothetical protein